MKKEKISKSRPRRLTGKKWSAQVTATSHALELEPDIFRSRDSQKIAASLKRSADKSRQKKGTSFQSAMSMLNFYINRAGKNLSAEQKEPLEKAKEELRKLYHKDQH
jgi:molecular chaperone DnaK (HSP70)